MTLIYHSLPQDLEQSKMIPSLRFDKAEFERNKPKTECCGITDMTETLNIAPSIWKNSLFTANYHPEIMLRMWNRDHLNNLFL